MEQMFRILNEGFKHNPLCDREQIISTVHYRPSHYRPLTVPSLRGR